ncbi:Ribosome biogenesis protein [Lachnellula subtilissima]|uniref:Ribosome biogenesis protein NOP53 n=1 Tax=Lachnellula subtilissima TaxID=602034 RepID=A0A8H8RYD8_9HELO|nr:Ribosome biogenesis protein [Lachnellula subtilissima]
MPIVKPATLAPDAPQQHKQPSRKGKKAWRKNVDVTEIQEGLEEVREQIITGGVIAEKDSSELFAVDTAGDISIPRKFLKETKRLKADEIIAQRSAVPAVSIRKRPGDNTTNGLAQPKRQKTSYVSHKELTRLRNIADGRKNKALVEVTEASFDPWDIQKDVEEAKQDPRFSFLEKSKKKTAPKTLKQRPISLAASGKDIPAVKKPEGGYSYNPMFADYEERLTTEGNKETEAEKKRLAAAEAERVKFEAATKSAAEAEAAEARADLSEWEEDSAWEGIESGAEDVRLNAKRPERKTQVQRNKIKRRKEEERKAKMAADIKKKNEQTAQIAKALNAKETSRALALLMDDDDSSEGDDLELRRRKLGKIALPERDLELVLPDELQESLRLLKPEGNLLKDRYRNLLVRGKVESRRPISFSKKAKRKATEKWTHKDFMLH